MENRDKEPKKQNKEAMRKFEGMTIEEQIEYVNSSLEEIGGDTNSLGDVTEFSYAWVRGILAKSNVYYIGSLKKFVMTNPFTAEEIAFFKNLYENKDSIIIGSKEETEEGMTLEKTVNKKIGSAKEVSQNRSFYISDNIFFHFKAFCNIQKSVTNKQLMELALIELMEKFEVDKTKLEMAYQEVLKENEKIRNKNISKKKDEAVDEDRFFD
ncbi:hypothetical protein [Clostridium sp.]|uniref:hypothetical protein n=1 Tax=Clostridium sp. TaxID=1506 RepID=UPI0028462AFC|nr:hypothetical protein [Clostridium sp.]MDR3598715.1 hypothetical protein [Clostridium sp.]